MTNRMMDFSEFKERVQAKGHRGNAIAGLWNDLAKYLVGFHRQGGNDKPADCLLPVNKLLKLTLEEVISIPGLGSAKRTVFGALHQSLRDNSDVFRDRTVEISREGLAAFAPSSTPTDKARASIAWKGLVNGVGVHPTVNQITAFCVNRRKGGERVLGFGESHIELLEEWVEHLRRSR